MNFARQVSIARRWGGIATLPAGVPVGVSVYSFQMTGEHLLPSWLFQVLLFSLFPAIVLLVFGGVGRPLHRTMWLMIRGSNKPYSNKRYGAQDMELFRLWVGDSSEYEDRP
jgi:hypothetical protein